MASIKPGGIQWLYASVRPGGQWDFKASWRAPKQRAFSFYGRKVSVDDFGNIHYGYIMKSLTSPDAVTVLGAAAAGMYKKYTQSGADGLVGQLRWEVRNAGYVKWGIALRRQFGPYGPTSVGYFRGAPGRRIPSLRAMRQLA